MLKPENLEGIIENGVGAVGVRVIGREKGWEQFDNMERFALALHDWFVKTASTHGFDKIDFMEKLNEYNAHMANATKSITVGGNSDPSFFTLFGDMQVRHPNHMLYELFKTKLLYFATVKANKLMRKDIMTVMKLAKTLNNEKVMEAIESAGLVWMGDEEIDMLRETYWVESNELIEIK